MLLPNATLLQTTTTHETIALPPSHLNPQSSPLLPSPQILLFLTIQILIFFLPHIYKRYTNHHHHHHNPSPHPCQHPDLTQELAALTTALALLRHRIALLEKEISHTTTLYPPSPAPSATQLLQSVSDDGEQYNEFGFPPPLEEGDDLMLPSPVVGKVGGHAALGCFYRRGVVYERMWRREGGEGGGAGGEECVDGEDY